MKSFQLFVFLLLIIPWVNGCSEKEVPAPDTGDLLVPLELSEVEVAGEIGRRIKLTLENNILALNVDDDFLATFLKRDGQDETFVGLGMLTDAIVKLAAHTNNQQAVSLKEYIVAEIIKAQEPDGYLGNMISENRMWKAWDIHEMGYIIYGLINDYTYFGNSQSLSAARKGADYIVKNWSTMPANWEKTTTIAVHVCVTGIERTMLTLYDVTGDNRYLEFCTNQRDLPNWDPGIVIGRRTLIEGHIYGYMASALAQLELYRMFPEEKLLGPSLKAMNFLTAKEGMAITGGAGQAEIWTADQDGRGDLGETCATAYMIRVFESLLKLKGDSRYGDLMERSIYNALFGAQSPDGRHIRYYTPMEDDRVYCKMDTYCCPNNFRRIVSELPGMIYYRSGNGVAINLYSSSSANIALEGELTVEMKQETDYPNSGHVVVTIDPSKPSSFPLKLRIPSWCNEARILVNGKPLDTRCSAGAFAVIDRLWQTGDRVLLQMPMEWRLVEGRQRQSGRAAVMRGPIVYCLNSLQDESLAHMDGAELGHIVIDRASMQQNPVNNSSIRPNGTACLLRAGNSPFAMGNAGNIELTLTEFADPGGQCTYFKLPDLSETVSDELTELWK